MMPSTYQTYANMKDSGVEWLGEIPEGWEIKSLKFIAYMESGSSISPEDFTEKGFPVFGGNGFRGYTNKYTNIGKHILIGRQGALCGNVNYAQNDFFASEHAIVVYPLNNENVIWLGEAIRIAKFNRFSQSAAQPGIAVNIIKNVFFPYPPLPEQAAIAHFLDEKTGKIDAAVAIKKKQIELLKERKQILIQNAVTQGLNPNASMRDSGVAWIGDIPEGWEVRRLASFGSFSKGGGFSKSDLLESGVAAILYGDIYTQYEHVINKSKRRISSIIAEKSIKLHCGDLLFTGSGETKEDIGKCVLFNSNEKTVAGGDIIIFKAKNHNKLFLSYYLNSHGIIEKKAQSSKGEIIIHTYASKLRELYVLLPPITEQTAIVAHIEKQSAKIDKAIALNQQQIEKLNEYKTTLINSAVTGKIKVT